MTAITRHESAPDWSADLKGAALLFKSGMGPASIKSPEQALFVILTGRDLGLSPTQSLRSINVIQGKVEVAADMQLALFKRAGGRAVWRTLTAETAVLDLTHPNGDKHTESFTIADARQAGLSGGNYAKFPKAMLRSRCITAGMKSVGFDVLAGVYAEGELGGDAPKPTATVATSEPAPDIGTPATTVVDADVVNTETGEVLEPFPSDALAQANAYVIPFGFLKGKEVGQVETKDLEKTRDWAQKNNARDRFAEFLTAADAVLYSRQTEAPISGVPGEAPEGAPDKAPDPAAEKPKRVTIEESAGVGMPVGSDASLGLPF